MDTGRRLKKAPIFNDQSKIIRCLETKNYQSAERRAEVECVLRILKDFIKKLKVCLSSFQNGSEVHEILLKVIEKSKGYQIETGFRTKELLKLLEYIDDNSNEQTILEQSAPLLSGKDESLFHSFVLLYNIAEQRLQRSALSDLSKEKKVHKLNRSLASIKKSVEEHTEKFRKQKIVYLWNLAYKGGLIQNYEEDLAFQKWDNNMRIKQEIVRSSKNIRSLQELSFGILKELGLEITAKRITYERLLRDNLMLEREGRMKKKKLLFQLQTHIHKFDQNIVKKIKENLRLHEDYEEKKRQFDEFMVEYLRQEKEFNLIMLQKEKEEQQVFEEKLMVFMMGRAARVIQSYWRRFRRDQKKKSKRGKGKGKRK